jgi:murein DD-endopeptidase MepM/ murein hydrolase activator NlpD
VHLHAFALITGTLSIFALLSPSDNAEATRNSTLDEKEVFGQTTPRDITTLPIPSPGNEHETTGQTATPAISHWKTVTVKRGDTLSKIFSDLTINPWELQAVLDAGKLAKKLKQIVPGQTLAFDIRNGRLQALDYRLNKTDTLQFRPKDDGFEITLQERSIEKRISHATGSIESSLFLSAQQAGLPDKLIMELVAIFGWDIDFALDIRKGDHFSVLYEEHYLDGEKLNNGPIVAAEFSNNGKTYQAIRFADPKGNTNYYTPTGLSMRKTFLRSPVDFRRISSRFQRERNHPVLGKKRPHRGVDYAAATGTPIKAAGDGKITFRSRKGGYGKTIILQHGGKYTTLYAHMSNFRRGLRNGSRVKQGQTIGYVGKSGLATGPHLHYEFRVNGVHRNPLTVKLPTAAPINVIYKTAFNYQAVAALAQLDLIKRTQLALNSL